jgi:hypothetical protein
MGKRRAGCTSEATVHEWLPLEFERIAGLVDQQPPAVREVFHFMLAVAMEESRKATLLNTSHVEGRTWYSY